MHLYVYLQTLTMSQGMQRKYPLSQQVSLSRARQAMHGGHAQTRQHKQGTYYTSGSSVGTLKPARKILPLDLASMPTDARYNMKSLRSNPTLSSRRAPPTNVVRQVLLGPAASSPDECKSFIAGCPSARTNAQRRVRSCSHLAALQHRPSASACPDVRLLPLL
jgi:hypothetical protein